MTSAINPTNANGVYYYSVQPGTNGTITVKYTSASGTVVGPWTLSTSQNHNISPVVAP